MKLSGITSGLLAASIWGGMYVVSKVLLDVLPPFTLLALRLSLALIVLAFGFFKQPWQPIARRPFVQILGIGVIGFALSLGFQFVGTRLSTAINGAVITSATPAFVLLFAFLILKEAISPRKMAALAISSVGVLLIVDLSSARFSPDLLRGNLILVAAALTWALYSVLVRKSSGLTNNLQLTFIALIGGLIVVLPIGLWQASLQALPPLSGISIAGILYLGVISTAMAMLLWNRAFEKLEAGVASLTFFAQPVVGTIFGVIFLQEKTTPAFMLGGLLIAFGIWLAAIPPAASQ